MPVLVDSSLWVHQLRKSGDAAKRDRVNTLLENGEAYFPCVFDAIASARHEVLLETFIVFDDNTGWSAGALVRQDPENPRRWNPIMDVFDAVCRTAMACDPAYSLPGAPIGTPVDNALLYVTDAALRMVPRGAVGELALVLAVVLDESAVGRGVRQGPAEEDLRFHDAAVANTVQRTVTVMRRVVMERIW